MKIILMMHPKMRGSVMHYSIAGLFFMYPIAPPTETSKRPLYRLSLYPKLAGEKWNLLTEWKCPE